MLPGLLVIAALFSLSGSVMAFLMVYEEYARHFSDKRKPFQMAMETTVFAFVFLLVLTFVAAFFLRKL